MDRNASSEAAIPHQDSRTREGRQSQCRPPQLLALHERSLRQPEAEGSVRCVRVREGPRFSGRSPLMIPSLTELAEELGFTAVLVPLVFAGVLTGLMCVAQSIAQWFDERNL